MSLHIGEVTSQVDVQGVGAPAAQGGGGAKAPIWLERERHRRLVEDEAERRARVAGEGFDD
jgi:hypothetical protein